ncbi:MAG: malto-oligosyltrehalose synthase [Candidatus Acidiferrales bacterium]
MVDPRIPLTTYRLQFNRNFTFRDATDILEYLDRLGVTDIYASPLLQSRRGSVHGYDVTDPTRIDSDLGSEEQFGAFHSKLQEHGMGLLLDIVPNHMAASDENPWWMDVLENGPASAYAAYFDIDWHPPSRALDNKILLPVLGKFYGDVLNKQELRLAFRQGTFLLQYYDSVFPLGPKSYRFVLRHRQDVLANKLGSDSPPFHEFLGILSALASLPEGESLSIEAVGGRRQQVEGIKERLRQLYDGHPEFRKFFDENVDLFNGKRNNAGSFLLLDHLLFQQPYVLAYWQNVNEPINYRRFFTISDLVGIRVEDPVVFESVHSVVLRLIERGAVTGLRIDHIDGLRDPMGYLRRLQDRISGSSSESAPTDNSNEFYVIVEKILSGAERLPGEWPVQGTTGYEYLNAVNRLFVHPEGARKIERIYSRFVGNQLHYEDVLYQKKKLVMSTVLAVEMRYLGRQLGVLAGQDRYARDLARGDLAEALVETTACFPIYRTYIRGMELTRETKRYIESAVDAARARKPHLSPACFDFVRDVLLLKDSNHLFPDQKETRLAFVMRWQQFTGPIVAKGLEDTVLYVYCPLLSLNEVGGDPRPSAVPPTGFSEFVKDRQHHWRYALNATSTHDTKRGEDVRARIDVLSEIPAEWERHLNAWTCWNAAKKNVVDGHVAPDRNEEIFLYQTLIGAWPLEVSEMPQFRERMRSYAIKATREAMVYTRWTRPNIPHEQALTSFLAAILTPGKSNRFFEDFVNFQRKIAYFGMFNGLAQVLVKITSPGVSDFYQGCELWDLRLVDPDNRGPVDFKRRIALLSEIQERSQEDILGFSSELTENWHDGRIKLYVTWKALNFRRQNRRLFLDGQFLPIQVNGKRRDNVFAYARRKGKRWVLIVVPRWLAQTHAPMLLARASEYWCRSQILLPVSAPDRWVNVLTGETCTTRDHGRQTLPLDQVFGNFPVALLSGDVAYHGS